MKTIKRNFHAKTCKIISSLLNVFVSFCIK